MPKLLMMELILMTIKHFYILTNIYNLNNLTHSAEWFLNLIFFIINLYYYLLLKCC